MRKTEEKPLEAPASPTPFDISTPGDIVVPFDKINEPVSEKQGAARESEQTAASEKPDNAPKKQARHSHAAEEKASGKKPELTPTQKGAQTRKARRSEVIDFMEGKRTSSLPDGKSVPMPAISAAKKKVPAKEKTPAPRPEAPQEPKEAPRKGETEKIVYLKHSELFSFKGHPFQIRNDDAMKSLIESVKKRGVDQPAIVRPRAEGGYDIVAGHRRQRASELAGYSDVPCVIRNMTDEEAVLAMVESNFNQRAEILPSERAKALKMQLKAIKRQGARDDLSASGQLGPKLENGQRSNAVVAERNKMTVKQVQRYIKLNDLVPDLMNMVDDKKISFTPAVEMSFIRPKNQRYIAIAIEG